MSTFITSDLHLGHANLAINYRKFDSVIEHDLMIIKNWNKVIHKHDKVYVLGDITMENHKYYPLLDKLNGYITVVAGNHDLEKDVPYLNNYVEKVVGCIYYKKFILTHIPIHPSQISHEIIGNIHGHMHRRRILDSRYFNACLDLNNYTPIDFEYIKEVFKNGNPLPSVWEIPSEDQ